LVRSAGRCPMPRIADAARRPPLPVHVRPGGDRLVRPEPLLKDFRNHSCSNSVRMRGLSVNWPRSHHTGQGTAAEYWPRIPWGVFGLSPGLPATLTLALRTACTAGCRTTPIRRVRRIRDSAGRRAAFEVAAQRGQPPAWRAARRGRSSSSSSFSLRFCFREQTDRPAVQLPPLCRLSSH
jgi:hypothetical protein